MEVLEDLREHIRFSESHIEDIRFDKTAMSELCRVGLYLSILELAGSIYALFRSDCVTGAAVLLRSQMEARVDLQNMANDEKYFLSIEAADTEQWLKIMRTAEKRENEYVQGLADHPEFQADFVDKTERLDQLKADGRGPLQVYERFKRAGMENLYRTVYNDLCTEGHNNFRALTKRHFVIDRERETVDVAYNKNSHDGSHDHLVTMTSENLLAAGVLLHTEPVKANFSTRFDTFKRHEQKHFS